MEQVTKFKAIDGKLFDTSDECGAWDFHIMEVRSFMDLLAPLPKESNCNYSNGDGYVQQQLPVVEHAMRGIVRLAKIEMKHGENIGFQNSPFSYRHSIIGRILDDGSDPHLRNAWYRFMCMDAQCREWGQPYFASHPHEGKQHEIKTSAQDKEAVAQHLTSPMPVHSAGENK